MSSKAITYLDDFTHEEIIFFMRQGKLYSYLREKESKRFIKRLRIVYLIYRGVFEKCYSERKDKGKSKSNNLHLETHLSSEIEVNPYLSLSEFANSINDIFKQLHNYALENCFNEYNVLPEQEEYALSSESQVEEPCYMDRCE
jgi:hypothetical protein